MVGCHIDITQRKLSEKILQLTRFTIECASDAVFWITPDARLFDANEAACRSLGYTRDELLQLSVPDVDLQYNAALWPEHFEELRRRGSLTFESVHRAKDGRPFPVEIVANHLRFGEEEMNCAFVRDITERKQAEAALISTKEKAEENEKKYRGLLANLPTGVVVHAKDTTILMCNARSCELLGLSEDQMKGKVAIDPYWKFIYEDQRPLPLHDYPVMRILNSKSAMENQILGVCRDENTIIWLLVNGFPVLNVDHEIQEVIISFVDITKTKLAEQAMTKAKEHAEESEILYRKMNENSPLGMHFYTLKNDQLIFTGANPAADKILNTDNSQFIGKTIEEAFPHLAQNEVPSRYRDAAQKGISWATEELYYKDNRIVGAFEVRAFQTTPGNMVAVFDNITPRKQAEEEVQKQLKEKETLLKEIHHRVKNNIANIQGLLTLQVDETDDPDVKTALHDAISRIQSIGVLYNRLLLVNDYQDVSIKTYAESLIDALIEVYATDNITIERHISEFVISSKAATSVGIIINELITNVFKYAFKGRDDGKVLISVTKDENRVTLTIHDNGIGTDEKIDTKKSPGFGLTMVKLLVEQLHGDFCMVNEHGNKAVVRFEI
jgi:PAS domain S-box-containing protein